MKKTIKILLLFLVLLSICTSYSFANETVPISEDKAEIITEEAPMQQPTITNRDIYLLAEDEVVMSELVNGNAFIVGNNVTITGQIAGDFYIIAQNLTIDSSAIIYNNVFALANQITVKGNVNDVYAISSTFTLDSAAYIARDLKLLSENVTLNGTIMKHAYISSPEIKFAEGKDSYTIGGSLYYTSPKEIVIPENSVMGEVKFSQIEEKVQSTQEILTDYFITFVNVIVFAIVIILLTVFITPNFANKASYCMSKRPFSTAGIGILSIVLIPLLSLVFLITGVLSYLGIALMTLYILILSITISILGISVGNYITSKFKEKTKTKFVLSSILSVACIWLLQLIPYIGGYISIFTVVFGLGIFVFSFFVKMKDKKEKKSVEVKKDAEK